MFSLLRAFLDTYGRGRKKAMILLTVGSVIVGFMELAGILLIFPLIALISDPQSIHTYRGLQYVYDLLGFSSDKSMVLFIAIIIAAIFSLKNIAMIFFHAWQQRFLAVWKNDICQQIMRSYLLAPYNFHLSRRLSDLINVLQNVVFDVIDNFILQAVLIFSCGISAGILIIFLLSAYLIPTLITAALLGTFLLIKTRYFRHVANRIDKEHVRLHEKNFKALQNGLSAIKDTKMLLKEAFFLQQYIKTNARVTKNDSMLLLFRYIPPATTEIALMLSVITLSCIMLYYAPSNTVAIANLGVLAALAFRMAPLINRSLNAYALMNSTKNSVKKLIEEFPTTFEASLMNEQQSQQPLILKKQMALKNISFCYPMAQQPVLTDINLTIQAGEFLGVVGRSGAGKTTLVDILVGLLMPTKGEYRFDDSAVTQENTRQLRKAIGYVHQHVFILNSSLRENVAFGCDPEEIDDAKVEDVLKTAQLYDFCQTLEKGIYTHLGECGKTLSGGQKQRIGIARALYHEPNIIILDEATSALDVETEHAFTTAIHAWKGKKTIVAIAHRLSTLKQCDRLVYMENGRILDIGTFEQLKCAYPAFARLVKLSQLESLHKGSDKKASFLNAT